MADLITHQFDGHPFAGRHGIGEVAEFEARYYEQAAVAWIAGRFMGLSGRYLGAFRSFSWVT